MKGSQNPPLSLPHTRKSIAATTHCRHHHIDTTYSDKESLDFAGWDFGN